MVKNGRIMFKCSSKPYIVYSIAYLLYFLIIKNKNENESNPKFKKIKQQQQYVADWTSIVLTLMIAACSIYMKQQNNYKREYRK